MDPKEALRRFERHPLRPLLQHLETILLSVARYAGQVVAVASSDGLVLWTGGNAEMVCAAKRVQLVPGAIWSESAAGTNALALAIELDHAMQVFSAEHFKQPMHGWSSAAAPVHDPETNRILGLLSLWGPLKAAHPHGFSIVLAAAQMAEAQLGHQAAERNERLKVHFLERVLRGCRSPCAVVNAAGRVLLSSPSGWLRGNLHLNPDGTLAREPSEPLRLEPIDGGAGFLVLGSRDDSETAAKAAFRLNGLGRDHAEGMIGHQQFRFTKRHSEIVVMLALHHPAGLGEDELMRALYGKTCRAVTVRAEISRLRKVVGPLVQTRPYRLAADVRADFLEVARLASAGRLDAAAGRYRGPLLPSSTAPGIVQARRRLERLVVSRALSLDPPHAARE